MDNLWNSSGRFSRIHYIGNPQRVSTDYGKFRVWTRELYKQVHLHVNVTLCGMQKENDERCVNNSKKIEHAKRFLRGHWSFLGLGIRKEVVRNFRLQTWCILESNGDEKCCWISKIVLQYFDVPAICWEQFRSKGGGKTTIHYNGSIKILGLLLQMIIAVNQLSLYGAVADMIAELPVGQRAPGKPVASVSWKKDKKFFHIFFSQGNLLQKHEEEIVRGPEVVQTMFRRKFEMSRSWTILLYSSVTKRRRKPIILQRIYVASRSRRNNDECPPLFHAFSNSLIATVCLVSFQLHWHKKYRVRFISCFLSFLRLSSLIEW